MAQHARLIARTRAAVPRWSGARARRMARRMQLAQGSAAESWPTAAAIAISTRPSAAGGSINLIIEHWSELARPRSTSAGARTSYSRRAGRGLRALSLFELVSLDRLGCEWSIIGCPGPLPHRAPLPFLHADIDSHNMFTSARGRAPRRTRGRALYRELCMRSCWSRARAQPIVLI